FLENCGFHSRGTVPAVSTRVYDLVRTMLSGRKATNSIPHCIEVLHGVCDGLIEKAAPLPYEATGYCFQNLVLQRAHFELHNIRHGHYLLLLMTATRGRSRISRARSTPDL